MRPPYRRVPADGSAPGGQRVEGGGQAMFDRDKVGVALHPQGQRRAQWMVRSQAWRGVRTAIDLLAEDGNDQSRALGKMAIKRANSDAGCSTIARTGVDAAGLKTAIAAWSSAPNCAAHLRPCIALRICAHVAMFSETVDSKQ